MSPGPDGDSCGTLTSGRRICTHALADAPNCILMSSLADEETQPQRGDVASPEWGDQDLDLREGPEARLLPSSTEKERCSLETLLGFP